ncbi:MAG TPA: choice-of-anchor tandem repeat GloVer-containing protein [Verrucomicrobiae bacterium]|nr:choice-of-anchor tandem repeat GloVer-containing protein [Verrucomicrobiae bacterium]
MARQNNMKALCVPTAVILLILAGSSRSASAFTSVTLTTLYQFSGTDGSNPQGPLTAGTDGNFYGATPTGGTAGKGTIFKITPEGALTTLHAFGLSDGAAPVAAPIEGSDGNFYGTTASGGTSNNGTVYQITSSGTFNSLYSFTGPDGANPRCQLVEGSDSNFYGTTRSGGTGDCIQGCGTVFMITPAGTLTTLYNFNGSDGRTADSGLVLATDGNFYGTTYTAGSSGAMRRHSPCDGVGDCGQYPPGTVYQITPAGTLTTLHTFSGRDGANPALGPIQGNDGAFYGVTLFGGRSKKGAVYTITSAGVFTLLGSFAGGNGGAFPGALLVQGSDGSFYGTTVNGGNSPNCSQGCGTLFRVTTDGTLSTLFSFAGHPAPGQPVSGLVQVGDSTFYGTSYSGGTNNLGTVFELDICDVSIDPTNISFAAAGGSDSIAVTTSNGCSWSATSNDGFITITSGAGSGNGTISYSVATNTSDLGRIGALMVFGAPVPVIQSGASGSGCAYSLSAATATIPAKGGSGTVSVKFKGPGCDWTAVSNDPFIMITSGSTGAGNGKVEYAVPGNTNSIPLTGTMTIAGQIFTVNQDAGSCTFSLNSYGASIKAAGGSHTVKVKPNFDDCAWTAVSNDSFITITDGASGTGKGTVTYAVAPNTNTVDITGSMTIAGQTYYVTQVGAK